MATRFPRDMAPALPDVLGNEPEPIPAQDPAAAALFEAIRLRASGYIDQVRFACWWRPVRGWCFEEGGARLVIAVPTPQFAMWWRGAYMGQLASCARELGREGLAFRFLVVEPEA